MKHAVLHHDFVEFVPQVLEQGVLYVSMPYATAAHLCCCGCGNKVVTPLTPTDWKLFYDGESISLTPSIGNWSFPCRSHYWIKHGKITWAGQWSQEEIAEGREQDRIAKKERLSRVYVPEDVTQQQTPEPVVETSGFWRRLWRWITSE
ncbi:MULTISPECIES: DUF6527 family protein [Hymenobacter]|uniref:Uncharacterized protein n=1 Tax=Hymenobacter metallilatus TaxID=2493666 RepID=A0A3R9LUQ6_9BACT|nr:MULTISPECIES: DUF6527 family protein [Hymenobacter]RSK23858.1 hypothetical protein EI290_21770 [Hymenobacter metallilatus]